jgi:hypothetical protein
MNTLIRSVTVVTVAVLLAVCVFGLCFAFDPTEWQKYIRAIRQREQLQQFQRAMSRHVEAKEHVLREVIAQRCSLGRGIARWQELDREWLQEVEREWPDAAIGFRLMRRQAWTDPAHYFHCFTRRATEQLRDRPEEAAAVLRRLEEEYEQLRAGRQAPSVNGKSPSNP